MTATLRDEEVVSHVSEFEIVKGRAPKIEFRVLIYFTDEEGNEWSIDRCFHAAPKKDCN